MSTLALAADDQETITTDLAPPQPSVNTPRQPPTTSRRSPRIPTPQQPSANTRVLVAHDHGTVTADLLGKGSA